jgi:hypothetical protein
MLKSLELLATTGLVIVVKARVMGSATALP